MRILFVAPYVPSPIRVRPYHILRELSRRHEVTVLAAAPSRELADVPALSEICRRVEAVPIRLSRAMRSCALAPLRGEPLQAAYCRSPELQGRLQTLLRQDAFDVVHIEHLRAAHLLDVLPASHPVVYDAVDSISLLQERTLAASHSWKQRLIALVELARTRSFERQVLDRVGYIAVTSEDDARAFRMLRSQHQPRIDVVPNGVDLEYFRPADSAQQLPEQPTVVISGKMSYHANVTAVLHFVRNILPLVRVDHPQVRVRIAGSEPPQEILQLSRDANIEVTGYLPDLREAIRGATVAVCPVTVKVGIQNKILEAMAMAVPVVSTEAGAMGLSVTHGKDLLVGRDAADVASCIGQMLADSNLRRQVALAGRRYVEENHSWAEAVTRFESLYQDAGAGKQRSASASSARCAV